jgi:hypothetical protein
MKSTLAVLLASVAVLGALGLPALSALNSNSVGTAASTAPDSGGGAMLLADNDDERRKAARRDHDDDDDDDNDDDDDDDDDDEDEDDERRHRPANAPAPAGAVAPPANGLFGNSAPPQVRTN